MMPLPEHFRDALESLRSHALRSVLAMLGIIIGTASLIAMLSIGSGAQERVAAQIGSLGARVLMIVPALERGAAEGIARPVTLTADDAEALADAVPEVSAVAPALQGQARAVNGNRNWSARVNGTTSDYFRIRDWSIASGRVFSRREEAAAGKVVMLGATVAARLFGPVDPVGRELRVFNTPMRVIGVLAAKDQSPNGRDQDDIIFMPFSTAALRLGVAVAGVAPGAATYILVRAHEGAPVDVAREAMTALLRQRHKAGPDMHPGFRIMDPTATISAQQASTRTISWLLAAVASISLLVGGIGIMNIMLVSVTERTREIGLRLALGARKRDIARLFLVEALVISIVGGAAGLGVGIAVSLVVTETAGWHTSLAADAVLAAVAFAGAVGIAFGYYPARKAAGMTPAEALRRE